MPTPYFIEADDIFQTEPVRVHKEEWTYEGRVRAWHHGDGTVLLRDAVRSDGEQFGALVVYDPISVERLSEMPSIKEVPVSAIRPLSYSIREYDDPDIDKFAAKTRQRGHLPSFPTVRRTGDGEYETVDGHRRVEIARRAGLDTIPAEVAELNDFEVLRRFVDEHFPHSNAEVDDSETVDDNDQKDGSATFYDGDEISRSIERMKHDWSAEVLMEVPQIARHMNQY